ncbi:TIGR01777 family oxidoreductase [Marinobacter daepoensis]|uniref:TIGR01777 family oxidoreductase n=1 Tax=Marinobacter daepoensis TaxID=262077 RepID=UPI001C956CFC|nr:TIGR01777 family oxidoreductase [Marinobacter daepoensis]MBY6032102.1 TIGR01777 family oxidoreductase [Marinobacter daepoensis]
MGKQILLTGATGFIGHILCRRLMEEGHSLTVLSRQSADAAKSVCGRVEVVQTLDTLRAHPGFDAVINLAGEGIADKRWSDARKQTLRSSRIELTRNLVQIVRSWQKLPEVMVSGSAVGYYGDQGDSLVTEDTPPHDEFTHRLCRDWEQEALELQADDVRVCLSRTGIVTGRHGGFLQRMLLPFKLGLGGRLGAGQQFMPWVHREDVVSGLLWMMGTPSANGAYNMVSPNPVTNRVFTQTLAQTLHRPALVPVPAAALKLMLGEMASLLLTGQKAIPRRLQEEGFKFRYTELEAALKESTGN